MEQLLNEKILRVMDEFLPIEQEELALHRQMVLEATESICENILTNRSSVDLTYEEFRVAFLDLEDMLKYYKDMYNTFSVTSTREDLLDYEFILNVLMTDIPELTEDYHTIQTAVGVLLKNTYNRVYSAIIMLLGAANIKFPEKSLQISRLYKRLSKSKEPKFTRA